MKPKKYHSVEDALEKMKKYCAYQERCHHDVRYKIIEYGVYGDDLEDIISELIQENYLNEERYAIAYVRGKFRQNNWGRNKIMVGLKAKHISDYCIKKGMQEIDEKIYLETASSIAKKRKSIKKYANQWDQKNDLTNYLMSRGYEYEIIQDALDAIGIK
jgi:regulatory protein